MSKIGFISLGCDKNSVDTEKILHILMENGHEMVVDENEAEIMIVNTCAFIKDAKEESINTIIEVGEYKKNNCKYVIVCGCLGERYKEEVFEEMPEVDAICGVHAYEKIGEVIKRLENGERNILLLEKEPIDTIIERVLTTTGHYEYLKIAEGCNNCCTYCAIPKIRGKYKSRKMEDIIEEAKYLAECGVKELMIVAQEITCYGIDLYGKYRLHELLHEIAQIEDIKWIRLLYCYPENITDELIEAMKNEPKICKYIDMPIQHTTDKILKLMGRKTNHDEIFGKIQKIRTQIPEVIIRSTLIVGFPGETEKDFEDLCNDVRNLKIDRLGVFDYSIEDGTPAEKMSGHIDDDIKIKRREKVMEIQEKISESNGKKYEGQIFEVIVDGYLHEDGVYCGRTYMDVVDVDGMVFFNSEREIMAGEFINVKIGSSVGYDLYGKEV